MGEVNNVKVAFYIVILIFVIATIRLIYQIVTAFDAKYNSPPYVNVSEDAESRKTELMKGFFAVLLFGLLAMLTYRYKDCKRPTRVVSVEKENPPPPPPPPGPPGPPGPPVTPVNPPIGYFHSPRGEI